MADRDPKSTLDRAVDELVDHIVDDIMHDVHAYYRPAPPSERETFLVWSQGTSVYVHRLRPPAAYISAERRARRYPGRKAPRRGGKRPRVRRRRRRPKITLIRAKRLRRYRRRRRAKKS